MMLCNFAILALFILPSIVVASSDWEIRKILERGANQKNLRELLGKSRDGDKRLFEGAEELLLRKGSDTKRIEGFEKTGDPDPDSLFSISSELTKVRDNHGVYFLFFDNFIDVTRSLLALPTKAAKALICMRFTILTHKESIAVFDLVLMFRPSILTDNIPIWLTSCAFNDKFWSMNFYKLRLDMASNTLLPLASINDLEKTLEILDKADEESQLNPQNPILGYFARRSTSSILYGKIKAALKDLMAPIIAGARESLENILPSVLIILTLEYI